MKKIIISLSVIGVVAGIAIGGTVAYFSDTETSTGNTFTAGTLNLQLRDTDEGPADGVTATWLLANMKPGDQTGLNFINLYNAGSVSSNHVEIAVANVTSDAVCEESDTHCPSTDLDKWMQIIDLTYDGVSQLGSIADSNLNGWKDLDDLEAAGLDNLSVPLVNSGGFKTMMMQVQFRSDAANDYQGDSLASTFTFTLNQDASQ